MKIKKYIREKLIFWSFLLFGVASVFVTCTFNKPENRVFEMKPVFKEGDTLSAYPEIAFVFSEAVADSGFSFNLSPDPGVTSYTYLSKEKDTAFFNISGILSGNTRYTVSIDNNIISESGSELLPADVSYSFYTCNTEKEPNNHIDQADSLIDPTYGIIYPADDIDVYFINDTAISGVYCNSESVNSKCSFTISDSGGDSLTAAVISRETDSLFFPAGFALPVAVKVNSYAGINNSKYHLGLIIR